MLIEKDGRIDNDINAVFLKNNTLVELTDDQWFQVTPTGKLLELWGKADNGLIFRLKYWHYRTVTVLGTTKVGQ